MHEIETEAKIIDLTVYTSAAEIRYEQEVTLEAGNNAVIFTGLTPFIEENTINVTVHDPAVNIITVRDKIDFITKQQRHSARVNAILDSIEINEHKHGLLKCKTDALKAEKKMLFGKSSFGGLSEGLSVEEVQKASEFFQKRYYEITTELFHLNAKRAKLLESNTQYNNEIQQLTTTETTTTSEIKVVIKSPSKRKVKIEFKLLTAKGGWAPAYDFKYQGSDKPLNFVFRANVFNASGVSWDDVKLKLSTADPIRGFNVPSLTDESSSTVSNNETGVTFNEITVSNVIAEYQIKHKYDIPSDAKPYLVEVDNYLVPSSFSYLVLPKLDPFGFLMAEIPDWNKYNLIPGITSIYNKGTYMGKTFLNTYARNDTLSVFLGKDKNIQATRNERNVDHPRNVVGNFAVDKTWINITVKNNHAKPLRITVVDQVPIDDGGRAKIKVTGIDGAVHDKQAGTVSWNYELAAGQTDEISFKFEIKVAKEYRDKMTSSFYRAKFRTISCPRFL